MDKKESIAHIPSTALTNSDYQNENIIGPRLLLDLKLQQRSTTVIAVILSAVGMVALFSGHFIPDSEARVIFDLIVSTLLLSAVIITYLARTHKDIDTDTAVENYLIAKYSYSKSSETNHHEKSEKVQSHPNSETNTPEQDRLIAFDSRLADLESISRIFDITSDRLRREAAKQGVRGNINLAFGISIAISGLVLLGQTILTSSAHKTIEDLIIDSFPRLCLVILIEVFAYFFLNLYKQSLPEIKFFQNEVTNIESRRAAILFAYRDASTDLRKIITEELIRTERNFLMSKDQTTVDIEKERLSRSTYSDLLSAIKELGKRKE